MFYVRVPQRLDQYSLWSDKGKYIGILIGGELYTYKEYVRLRKISNMPFLSDWLIIPRSKVVWFMGARLPVIEKDGGEYRGTSVDFEEVYLHYNR